MLKIKSKSECRWDIVSLGEVMLRFDPGGNRVQTANSFRVWEGGGEYNVARNIARCFAMDSAVVTAFADNQVGRLVEGLIRRGGVDVSQVLWVPTDGMSRGVRNGLYFMERGFGPRPPTGCSDRGNTAISKLQPGDVDWGEIFSGNGARWFHTGGIFAGLSESTAAVAEEAMSAAKASGVAVSYDLNYRASLWADRGGMAAANELNDRLLEHADVVFGIEGFDPSLAAYSEDAFRSAAEAMLERHPNLKIAATTLRDVHSASRHDLAGACYSGGSFSRSKEHLAVDVLDRVGSGDAFAAGLIFGILDGRALEDALELAAASGVLAMAGAGDGSTATLDEIERLARGHGSSAVR